MRDLDLARVNEWLVIMRQGGRQPSLPAGQAEFTPREVRHLLGVTKESVGAAVRRHSLQARGNGKARRFPRATVEALCGLSSRGVSPESINHYVRAIRSFMRWMVLKAKRLPSNPLDGLELVDAPQAERRHGRRELTADQLTGLLAATMANKRAFRGLDSEARYHLYLCACGTGFRAAALASLCPENFHLDDETPTVVLAVRDDKSRKGRTQPLPLDLAYELRGYIFSRPASLPVWGDAWVKDGAEILRGDLEAAGIPYVVEGPDGPEYADFHSLRHSYITALGRAGVDLRTAQELAGHSTPILTARYMHVRLHDLAGGVEKLPDFVPSDSPRCEQVEALRATGTDSVGLSPVCTGFVQTVDPGCNRMRLSEEGKKSELCNNEDVTRSSIIPLRLIEAGCKEVREEAPPGFEPGNDGFAIRCLSAWRRGRVGLPTRLLSARAASDLTGESL